MQQQEAVFDCRAKKQLLVAACQKKAYLIHEEDGASGACCSCLQPTQPPQTGLAPGPAWQLQRCVAMQARECLARPKTRLIKEVPNTHADPPALQTSNDRLPRKLRGRDKRCISQILSKAILHEQAVFRLQDRLPGWTAQCSQALHAARPQHSTLQCTSRRRRRSGAYC